MIFFFAFRKVIKISILSYSDTQIFKNVFIYLLRERGGKSASREGAERERGRERDGDRESQAGLALSVQNLIWG